MKIRIKSLVKDNKEEFVYEVDDEKGKTASINVKYLETALKILDMVNKKMTIKNAKAFGKFITNIKRSTRYYDKMQKKAIETPNILHRRIDNEELDKYHEKYVKYDRKSQALFSLHSGWYDNFISIVEEIKNVIEENYSLIKDMDENDNELLYVANRIDGILENYRKKQKVKTL